MLIEKWKNKLSQINKNNIDEGLKFELEMIKYRLKNLLGKKKIGDYIIKDINPQRTYEFRKFNQYCIINEIPENLVKFFTGKEIKEISNLKFKDFQNHYDQIKNKKIQQLNNLYKEKYK